MLLVEQAELDVAINVQTPPLHFGGAVLGRLEHVPRAVIGVRLVHIAGREQLLEGVVLHLAGAGLFVSYRPRVGMPGNLR